MLKNLELAIKEKFIKKGLAAKALEIHPGNLTKLLATPPEAVDKLWNTTLIKLEQTFPEYNINWLLGKSPIKYKEDVNNKELTPKLKTTSQGNTKIIGHLPDDEIAMFDDEGNTKFYEISPGVYRMKVPLIPETAKAGYLTGFADAEFIEGQEYIVTTVYKYHKGRYNAFRVVGDSMDIDKRTTFIHGDIIIGREIKQELWRSPFHTHKYPYYVFVTKNDGIIFKQLISHDVANGVVNLRSLNEDKTSYPDFEINLNDVVFVYNIVKRESEI